MDGRIKVLKDQIRKHSTKASLRLRIDINIIRSTYRASHINVQINDPHQLISINTCSFDKNHIDSHSFPIEEIQLDGREFSIQERLSE